MLDGGKKHYAHMINGTLCACQRLICALLENHQDEDGVKLPTVLQPYMHGIARLPFVKLANIEDYDLDKKNAVKAMRTAARKKDRFPSYHFDTARTQQQTFTAAYNQGQRKCQYPSCCDE